MADTGVSTLLVVLEDCELHSAVEAAHQSIERSNTTSRILAHRNVYDDFVELLLNRIEGSGQLPESRVQASQPSAEEYQRIRSYAESGKADGATIVTGGIPLGGNLKGFYKHPTVFTNVRPDMRIFRELVNGPVAVVCAFETEQEVTEWAHDAMHGLGVTVFSKDSQRADAVAARIESDTASVKRS